MDVLRKVNSDLDLEGGKVLPLTELLYAPDFLLNLLRICILAENKCGVHFKGKNIYVIIGTNVILVDEINKNLYAVGKYICVNVELDFDFEPKSMKWHKGLGHIGQERLTRSAKNVLTGLLNNVN